MKTKLKLGLGMVSFGVVLAVFASFAIRQHGQAKLTVRGAASETQSQAPTNASASAKLEASAAQSASASSAR